MIDFVAKPMSGATLVVQVSDQLTEVDRGYFFSCIRDYIDSGYHNVIIDCSKLGYISSSGLALLLAARKRVAKNGGRVILTHINSNLAEVLEVTKLGRLLSLYPTTEAAIANIEHNLACVG